MKKAQGNENKILYSKGKKTMVVTNRQVEDDALVLAFANDSDSWIVGSGDSFCEKGDVSRLSNYEKRHVRQSLS